MHFAERPGGNKNVERLDFLKFSPVAQVNGEVSHLGEDAFATSPPTTQKRELKEGFTFVGRDFTL